MKKLLSSFLLALMPLLALAQGWPEKYDGVMLQGFYWNSFNDTRWATLERQADEISQFFDLIWIPQSGRAANATSSMGYDPLYYFNQNSAFGTEAQLRSLINTYKSKGTGMIADVVINHRANVSNWVDFPAENYKGVNYQMKSTDICRDDDGGKALTWAKSNGYELSVNNDEGEDWDGMRDLDHMSENVQECVNAYCDYLIKDLGYTGFRYDVAKGFGADKLALYNKNCGVQYSVAEYWDGNAGTLTTFLNRARIDNVRYTATFDFNFRYAVRDATNNANGWKNLSVPALVSSSNTRRYAVTFVENHDTESRIDGNQQDPIRRDTLAANAFMMSMPGTPCVFLTHWKPYKNEIKSMIAIRKAAGLHSECTVTKYTNSTSYNYAVFRSLGTKATLFCVVGPDAQKADVSTLSGFDGVEVMKGHRFRLFLAPNAETVILDRWTGDYTEPFDVTVKAVSATTGAQIVYTTDGSEPTASSTKVANGGKIHIDATTTLKVGLLTGGTVKSVTTNTYTFTNENKKKITVYVNAEAVNWTKVNFWSWGGDGTHAPESGGWPGDAVTTTTTIKDKKWFSKDFWISGSTDYVDLVFSTGNGSPQTVDVVGTDKDAYYEISTELDGIKHLVTDVTKEMTNAVNDVKTATTDVPVNVYTIDGRLVRRGVMPADATNGLDRGLYIVGHKKVIVR